MRSLDVAHNDPWRPVEPGSVTAIPAVSAESEGFRFDRRRRGLGFVGPTVCDGHLQARGRVNDHPEGCVRQAQLKSGVASGRGPRSGS